MAPSSVDIDYGTWKKGVAKVLHEGAFSGSVGEMSELRTMEKFTTTPVSTAAPAAASLSTALQTNTDLLAQMNSSSYAHDYITTAVQLEQTRISNLDFRATRDVYKLREVSLGVVYSEDLCKFLTILARVVLFSSMLIVLILSATAQRIISRRSGIFFGIAVVVLTGLAILALVANAATRRNDAWGHYYWKTSVTANSGTQCPNSSG